jgi:sugar O-acyltransferase (sialic acid O-acetyltransferase NeuD family)
MKDIAIYGAGGFGKEVACLIKRINADTPTWNLIGFFDDAPALKGKMISHFGPCMGGIDVVNEYPKELAVVMALGNSKITKKLVESITNKKIYYPNLIDISFHKVDPETFVIGQGNIIQGPGGATCDVTIGDFNVLNGSVVIGHDVTIGSFNTFMPAVRVSGEVKIGDLNFFGVGSIILQLLKVGNNVRLGAGSVLMTKPKEGCLYLGVPAKKTDL